MSALETYEIAQTVKSLRAVAEKLKASAPLLSTRASALAAEVEAHAANPRRAIRPGVTT